jgi:hypothetical protein
MDSGQRQTVAKVGIQAHIRGDGGKLPQMPGGDRKEPDIPLKWRDKGDRRKGELMEPPGDERQVTPPADFNFVIF